MKEFYVADILKSKSMKSHIKIQGWLKNRRRKGKIIFLDFCDSTGQIQVVVNSANLSESIFETAKKIPVESAIEIQGTLQEGINNTIEIDADNVTIIGSVDKQFSPQPRSDFDVFDPKLADYLLSNRHIYLRNPKIMAILEFRHILMNHMRQWFNNNGFIEINAPILTPVPLYDDASAISVQIHGDNVFLTQCVGFYLEAAAHAFERVYNMGPSFRGEESRSKRHLMEYWHIKAEIAFGNIEDIIKIVEDIINYLVRKCQENTEKIFEVLKTDLCLDGIKTPYSRIKYQDAVDYLQDKGFDIQFGKGLGSDEEKELSKLFDGPFWIMGIPRVIEPFPYSIDPQDNRLTVTADLIASKGFGELLGVAEKIYSLDMFDERLYNKGKMDNPNYGWIREVHQIG